VAYGVEVFVLTHIVCRDRSHFWATCIDDLEKAREAARSIPGGSDSLQAVRNTGLVIRIAIANALAKCVIPGLLADDAAGIKRGIEACRALDATTS